MGYLTMPLIYLFIRHLRKRLQKATIRAAMFVRLFVRMEKLDSHWTNFHEILYYGCVLKSVDQFHVEKRQTLYVETEVHLFSYLVIYESVTGTRNKAQPDRPKKQLTI
jgi:hypothetical protein